MMISVVVISVPTYTHMYTNTPALRTCVCSAGMKRASFACATQVLVGKEKEGGGARRDDK